MLARLTAAGAVLAMGRAALAATDDEWETFRRDVAAQCLKAAEPMFETAEAVVDPFGSESYGLALIRGTAKGVPDAEIAAICVYDKQTKAVEVGGELPAGE